MDSNGIFDKDGRIRTFKPSHLNFPSNREKVDYYGRKYTSTLVDDAKKGAEDFELFMELKRRAAEEHLKHNIRIKWDNEDGYSNANAAFIKEYDRKWKIIQKGCLTYMMAPGEVLR